MKIKNNGSVIILESPFDNKDKILSGVYLLTFIITGVGLIITTNIEKKIGFELAVFIGVGLFLFLAFRFLNKMLQGQTLLIRANTITLINSGFLNKKVVEFDTKSIENFRFLNIGNPYVFNLAFDYKNETIIFGKNIFSWDFEKIREAMYTIVGNDFR